MLKPTDIALQRLREMVKWVPFTKKIKTKLLVMKKDSFKKVRLAAIESNIILRVVKKKCFFYFFFKSCKTRILLININLYETNINQFPVLSIEHQNFIYSGLLVACNIHERFQTLLKNNI